MARSYSLEGVAPRPDEPGSGQSIDYRAELNDQQYEAVTSLMGPALVIAGAGSGKTRTLTYRVAYLLDNGIAPENILLLTFTNKAAREMNERVEQLAPASTAGIWAGTFHSIGARILRRHAERIGFTRNFGILDSDDQRSMLTKIIKESRVAENAQERLGEKFPKPAVIASILGLAANTDVPVEQILAEKYSFFEDTDKAILKVGALYDEKKKAGNHMDFDDLLVRTRQLLAEDKEIRALYQSQFQFILVDEYQDTNAVQGEVIDLLAEKHGNLMVVGDDAQSIYSWRGADYSNILEFPRRYPKAKVYKIETNYRSVPEVLALANASIRANQMQFPKELCAARPAKATLPAFVPVFDPNMQARFVSQRIRELHEEEGIEYDQMAVLYRSHFHSMELQMQLTRDGAPFVITSGLRFFEQAHIKDVAAYLKFAANPRDDVSFERIVKLMAGIGPASAEKLWQQWLKSDVMAAYEKDGRLPEKFSETLLKFKPPSKAKNDWEQMAHVMDELVNGGELSDPTKMIYSIREGIYDEFMKAAFDNADARKQDLDQFQAFASGFQKIDEFLEQMALLGGSEGDPNQDRKRESAPSVCLSSVHQAKGLEWKVVFVIWLADGMFPNRRAIEDGGLEALEEERRLFYVAVTRAEDELYLLYPEMWPKAYTGDTLQTPSRFLSDFPQDMVEEWRLGIERNGITMKGDKDTTKDWAKPAPKMKDLHENEQPREKLERLGPKALSDAELLAILFRTGRQGLNVVEMSRQLLRKFGSLQAMARLEAGDYQCISGIGKVKAIELSALFEIAGRVAKEEVMARPVQSPQEVYDLLGAEMRAMNKEVLRVVLLDTRSKVLRIEDVSVGTMDETIAHPRDILRPALVFNAHSFLLVHNHPSGDPSPSSADRQITRRIAEAAELLRIKFVDHIIIGQPRSGSDPYFSFREMGLL